MEEQEVFMVEEEVVEDMEEQVVHMAVVVEEMEEKDLVVHMLKRIRGVGLILLLLVGVME